MGRWCRRRRSRRSHSLLQHGDVRNILLTELTRLGDVLSALPAVVDVQRAFPQASVTWLVRNSYAELLRPAFSDVHIEGLPDRGTLRTLLEGVRLGRSRRWDLACSLGPGRLNGLVILLSRSSAWAGYLECSPSRTPFRYENPVSVIGYDGKEVVSPVGEPLALRPGRVCEVLNIPSHPPPLPLPLGDRWKTRGVRAQGEPALSARPIVLHPFARWKYRMWVPERWVALARRLSDEGWPVTVVGRSKEVAGVAGLLAVLPDNYAVRIVRADSLPDAAKIIGGAGLFIGCDSGPLHLATALGVPSIGLYGPADPKVTQPAWSVQTPFRAVYHRMDCSPCDQRRCVHPEFPCMSHLTVDTVVEHARSLLPARPYDQTHGHG
jgi:ADP-heptose:LPS heptosyltransferase